MAAKKKAPAKKAAARPARSGKAKPKPKPKATAKAPARRAAKGEGVTYSDVLHELRSSLVARLIR